MANLNPQAVALNETIRAVNPNVYDLLSARGRAILFPAKGILAQTAEAKGKRINATIGVALEDDGSPLRLECIEEQINLDPKDAFAYAPSFGKPELRQVWKQMLYQKNPSLVGRELSVPVVTQALTHALSICGYLFLDEGDQIIIPDLYWGNYRLIFEHAYGAKISTFETFAGGGFNVAGFKAKLNAGTPGKRVLLLNFPNNPTGYTVTEAEAAELQQAMLAAAEAGNQIVALIDDAYFGLVYEDGIAAESIFTGLANAHERLLAVKIDGATKEDYVWGFRVGFISYGVKGGSEALYKALEAKTAGAIRGNISNSPHISQSLMLKAFTHPDYAAQKQQKYQTLKQRYAKVKEILAAHPEYAEAFAPLPFNSGYFMCVKLEGAEPEAVRQILLNEFDTGLIAAAGVIRIAFSSAPLAALDELFANLYQAVLKARN